MANALKYFKKVAHLFFLEQALGSRSQRWQKEHRLIVIETSIRHFLAKPLGEGCTGCPPAKAWSWEYW